MWTTKKVESALQEYGEFSASLAAFMELYGKNRELFFQLACIGVSTDAPRWMQEVAVMAAYLRALASGFMLEGAPTARTISSCVNMVPNLSFSDISVDTVRTFMRSIDGFPTELDEPEQPGERMRGRRVTEAQSNYHLGIKRGDTYEDKFETYLHRQQALSLS